ncbi:MAG: outer membrane beta-barrel protein [Candidatus Binataceae bacterium]
MNRTRTSLAAVTRMVAIAVAVSMLFGASAFAAAKKKKHYHHKRVYRHARMMARPMMTTEEQRLNALTGQVNNLQNQANATNSEVQNIERQIAVAQPPANTQPATIGQHVGKLETDFGNLQTDLEQNLGIHVHGLVDAGYEYNINQPNTSPYAKGGYNPYATGGALNQYRVFDPNANSFELTQGNLEISRVKEGGVGFLLDLNVGTVANVLANSTRYSNIYPGEQGSNWIDPTQFYLTYTAPVGNGINLKAGRMVTLLGEETVNTPENLNYNESKSLLFGYAIPFTVTGVRAQYQFNEYFGATLGVVNGWDDIVDNNAGKTLEGQIALNNKDKSLAFTLSGIWGAEEINRSSSKRMDLDPIVTWKPQFLQNVTLIDEFNWGHQTGPVTVFPAVTSYPNSGACPQYGNNLACNPINPNGGFIVNHAVQWYGDAAYIVYDYSDALEFATRGEWFKDPDGARTGLRQTLGEVTETLSYKIPGVSGLLTRLEYRHDESSAHPFFSNQGVSPLGYDLPAHTYSGQDTISAAAIYTF